MRRRCGDGQSSVPARVQIAMDGTRSGTTRLASVFATTSLTRNSGAVSCSKAPASEKEITASSVTSRSILRVDVSGRVHRRKTLDLPFAQCCMATTTRFARRRVHGASHARHHLAGDHPVGELALLDRPADRRAPSCRDGRRGSGRSDMALSKVLAPGSAVTGRPPASVSARMRHALLRHRRRCRSVRSPTGRRHGGPGARWLATKVGMPIPRLTSMPGLSSRAMRCAMMSCALHGTSSVGDRGSRRAAPASRHGPGAITPTGTTCSAVDDHRVGRHRHHRIEVARRQRIG